MQDGIKRSSVEDLNQALRLYRRLALRIAAIFVGGIILGVALTKLGAVLAPPYGLYVLGQSLGMWALIAMLVLLIAEIWVDGRAIGKLLDDPVLRSMPLVGILSGLSIIAQRAHAMDMEWTGFLGPLRSNKR